MEREKVATHIVSYFRSFFPIHLVAEVVAAVEVDAVGGLRLTR